MVCQQMPQELRKRRLAQLGAEVVVCASRQRGRRAINMHFGVDIARWHLGHVVNPASLGSQRRVPVDRRLTHKAQLPVLWPRRGLRAVEHTKSAE
jgi:hypothetical protein